MNRDKLIERAGKLLAMSQDSGSPAEAAIADRRLKALIEKHHLTLEEIKGTKREDTSRTRHEGARKPSKRRKRTRPSAKQKQKRFSIRPNRVAPAMALCGIGVVLSLWIAFNGVEESSGGIKGILEPRQLENSAQSTAASLTTSVNRTSVIEGESIMLYLNGSGLSTKPNLSVLAPSFRIIEQQVKEGVKAQDFQIRMLLQPRQTGVLFIPSFFVDGIKSEQIILDVRPR